MTAEVTQALILAGGQATRMRPYTDDAPKAMVPVAGAPIVGYVISATREVLASGDALDAEFRTTELEL